MAFSSTILKLNTIKIQHINCFKPFKRMRGRTGIVAWHCDNFNISDHFKWGKWTLKQRKVHIDSRVRVPSACTSLSYTFVHNECSSR
jgi:hypothetical protein